MARRKLLIIGIDLTSLDTADAGGATWEEGWALFFLSLVALGRSDFAETERLANRAADTLRPVGDQEGLSWALCVSGAARWGSGDKTGAARRMAAGVRSFHDLGGLWGTSIALMFCGLLITGRPTSSPLAVRIIAASEELRESAGIGLIWYAEEWMRAAIATLTGRLGVEAFRHEWEKGRKLGVAAAVDAAVAELTR